MSIKKVPGETKLYSFDATPATHDILNNFPTPNIKRARVVGGDAIATTIGTSEDQTFASVSDSLVKLFSIYSRLECFVVGVLCRWYHGLKLTPLLSGR